MDKRASLIPGYEKILDRLVDIALAAGSIGSQTDKYFTNTSRIVASHGDMDVTFAVFMRRRVVAALEPTIRMVQRLVPSARVKRFYEEGDIVPSESKMLEITGSMAKLSEVAGLRRRGRCSRPWRQNHRSWRSSLYDSKPSEQIIPWRTC